MATSKPLSASPFISPGDAALRADIQRLADYGVIKGPVTTWPLGWGPIAADISVVPNSTDLPIAVTLAIARVRARADWEMRVDEMRYRAHVAAAENPVRIRSFQATPRESGEIGGGFAWIGDRLSVDLQGQIVDSPTDGEDYRVDGSAIAVAIGNFSLSANTLERWWGPGNDGSLILSNNARPIPSISLDRSFTDPFESKWLSWLGPWDLSVHYGQFETARFVPNARFFGMRFNFRPLPSLEVGLSRTAQWCGNGRPCGFDTFADLLIGKDNRGGRGIDPQNEPGNQLAGIDFRWVRDIFGLNTAMYGQLIGEDEAGGFPSRYIGQFGIESTGMFGDRWSYRWFGEFAGTSCQFHESTERFNCAYNHTIYETGYRYRGRTVGHGADNDSQLVSVGFSLVDDDEKSWQGVARYGAINRGGAADPRNSLTPTRQDVWSIDISYSQNFLFGVIGVGFGIEHVSDIVQARSRIDSSGFIRWQSAN